MWCAICIGDVDLCEFAWSKESDKFKAQNVINTFSSKKTMQRVIGQDLDPSRVQLLADYVRRVLRNESNSEYVESIPMPWFSKKLAACVLLERFLLHFSHVQVTVNEVQKGLLAEFLRTAWDQDIQNGMLETNTDVWRYIIFHFFGNPIFDFFHLF